MNKAAAQGIVYHLTARGLRKMVKRQKEWATFPDFPVNMTDSDKAKITKELLALAERLEGKFPEKAAVEHEPNPA